MAQPYAAKCSGSRIPRSVCTPQAQPVAQRPRRSMIPRRRAPSPCPSNRTYAVPQTPPRSRLSNTTYAVPQQAIARSRRVSNTTYDVPVANYDSPEAAVDDDFYEDPSGLDDNAADDLFMAYLTGGMGQLQQSYMGQLMNRPKNILQELDNYGPFWNNAAIQDWVNNIPDQGSRIARPIVIDIPNSDADVDTTRTQAAPVQVPRSCRIPVAKRIEQGYDEDFDEYDDY